MTLTVVYFIHFECVGQGAVQQITTGHVTVLFFIIQQMCYAAK